MVLPGAVETARLPKEYQEVEYIQSSGTQYIDTGFTPNQNTHVIAEMEYVSHTNQTCGLFGVGVTSTEVYEVYHYNGKYTFHYGATSYTATATVTTGKKMLIDVSGQQATISVNGAIVSVTPSEVATFTSAGTMYIHALHRSNGAGYLSITKTCSFKIYDNDTLVKDFVPCYRKADNVAGLYDTVNDVFHTNAGTGAFTVGPAINYIPVTGGIVEFAYSGNYTDGRVNGKGVVRLNTSGTLVVTGGKATVSVYILAGGGGAYVDTGYYYYSSGGSGGYQTVEVTLEPGTYEIIIGTGGAEGSGILMTNGAEGGAGGDTSAFGYTSTGGKGGHVGYSSNYGGAGGSPNGGEGSTSTSSATLSGGSPNGGGVVNGVPQPGGDGYVELTFI